MSIDDDDARKAAITFMRGRRMEHDRGRANSGATPQASRRNPSFADLPEYRELLAQYAAGKQLGITNPFFRAHEGRAGASSLVNGRTLVNFASYDYLGLNGHPLLAERAKEAIDRYGLSASASRLIAGERPIHEALERAIAGHYETDEAVVFVSGYLTNVTAIACLVGPSDLVLHDERIHHSALAGIRYSGATRRGFRHNDLDDMERSLASFATRHRRVLVIVEGLYSMDGDMADLAALVRLRRRYGFWLMVDEAHALGVLGGSGRGSFEHFGCDPREVDIWMGTLSKSAASCGGYIAGRRELVALLKGCAGGFVYSVGLAPALAAAALAAFQMIAEEAWRVCNLQENGRYLLTAARAAGLDTGTSAGLAIAPVMVGDSVRAVCLSNALFEQGFNVMPILFPAVPEGQARLRFFVTSEHSKAQIDDAIVATKNALAALVAGGVGMSMIDVDAIALAISLDRPSDRSVEGDAYERDGSCMARGET